MGKAHTKRVPTAEDAALTIECVIHADHTAAVKVCSNGCYTAYCQGCKTRMFFSSDTFRLLDKAGKIGHKK